VADLLANFDEAFWPALVAMALRLGTSAADHLAVFWSESRLNPRCIAVYPTRDGPPSGRCYEPGFEKNVAAAGLNQMTAVAMDATGFPKVEPFHARAKAYAELPPSAQLPYIERFHQTYASYIRGGGLGMLYVANAFPGLLAEAKKGPDVPLARKGTAIYAGNAGVDKGGKGYITLRDLESLAQEANKDPIFRAALAKLGDVAMTTSTASLTTRGLAVLITSGHKR